MYKFTKVAVTLTASTVNLEETCYLRRICKDRVQSNKVNHVRLKPRYFSRTAGTSRSRDFKYDVNRAPKVIPHPNPRYEAPPFCEGMPQASNKIVESLESVSHLSKR